MSGERPKLYLLDANVLISAHNTYYAIEMVPDFWSWLLHQADEGRLAMPRETFEEVRGGADATRDSLNEWMCRADVERALVLQEDVDENALRRVMAAYALDLNDSEVEQIARDPFLISYGMVDIDIRVVVTNEVSRPGKLRANQKVPDICRKVGVECCNTIGMLRALGFKTGWKKD
jgi:hypothetical protein